MQRHQRNRFATTDCVVKSIPVASKPDSHPTSFTELLLRSIRVIDKIITVNVWRHSLPHIYLENNEKHKPSIQIDIHHSFNAISI